MQSKPEARHCAITSVSMAHWANSSTILLSMIAKEDRVRTIVEVLSNASFSRDAQPFIAQNARSDQRDQLPGPRYVPGSAHLRIPPRWHQPFANSCVRESPLPVS